MQDWLPSCPHTPMRCAGVYVALLLVGVATVLTIMPCQTFSRLSICLTSSTAVTPPPVTPPQWPQSNAALDLSRCFRVLELCTGHDICLVKRALPGCEIDEYYPSINLRQGSMESTVLARENIIRGTHGFAFELPARGFAVDRPSNLTIALYFYNVTGMHGALPQFRRNVSSPHINQVIYQTAAYFMKPRAHARTKRPVGRIKPCVVDRETLRLVAFKRERAIGSNRQTRTSVSWIHLVGDSVMRANYLRLCASCSDHQNNPLLLIQGDRRDESTCFCREKNLVFHYDSAWLDRTPRLNHTGAMLSESPEARNAGYGIEKQALMTVLSLGSHSPQYSSEALRRAVPAFIEMFSSLTSKRLAVLLTTAVCIEKIPQHQLYTKGTWEYLLRNNYRIRDLNEVILETGAKLDIPVVDLFSWSLSVGCTHYVDAVHMTSTVHDGFVEKISKLWS